jgi:hypothetical protein
LLQPAAVLLPEMSSFLRATAGNLQSGRHLRSSRTMGRHGSSPLKKQKESTTAEYKAKQINKTAEE